MFNPGMSGSSSLLHIASKSRNWIVCGGKIKKFAIPRVFSEENLRTFFSPMMVFKGLLTPIFFLSLSP